jgi:hypothetical protein
VDEIHKPELLDVVEVGDREIPAGLAAPRGAKNWAVLVLVIFAGLLAAQLLGVSDSDNVVDDGETLVEETSRA